MHRKSSYLIALLIAGISIMLWATLNNPVEEAPWPDMVDGFSFSPYQIDQSPIDGKLPTSQQIQDDLRILSERTHSVRSYSVDGTLAEIPALAEPFGMKVTLGAWIGKNTADNDAQITKALEITAYASNVNRLIVGNESLLRNDISIPNMIVLLDRVRKQTHVPVSTAEPWHIWQENPELVKHVDYIAVHMLPYWEGQAAENAVNFVINKMNDLQLAYPNKPIVITEVGWPSNGLNKNQAWASTANQGLFLRQFLSTAAERNYQYFIMEAFDQPWKHVLEGDVGNYWGVFDANRQPKFQFVAPIVSIPDWPILAAMSVIIAIIAYGLLLIDSHSLHYRGRGFLAVISYLCATFFVYIIYDYSNQYLSIGGIIVGVFLMIGLIGVITVLLAEAHEWAEAIWTHEPRRLFKVKSVDDKDLPKVSIHVPCYNEPPDMMIETIDALANLDYPDFEVIIMDNNTKDPAVWQPVQAYCDTLGPNFRFFHEDPLAGYKSGALNFALKQTAEDAEVVAVIDADYQVHPRWLRDLTPQFENENMGIVQAPQDYSDAHESAFKAMCYAEYRGFFYIGMVTRNERNAIIQHGTMTMIRKSSLETAEGWAEWCITEDAELGLRVFESGQEASYVAKSYGKGVMPDTFIDYKKQRFRWAFGSMQILRKHLCGFIKPGCKNLTSGQRYHFLAGWLPWIADGFNLLFNLGAIAWTVALAFYPEHVPQPLVILTIIPIALFFFKIGKILYLYRVRVHATYVQTFTAAIAGLSLTHTIGLAMITGLFVKGMPFFRTPKKAENHAIKQALAAAREETMLMLALWLAATATLVTQDTNILNPWIWSIMLITQSIPYAAALIFSLISAMPNLSGKWIGELDSMNKASKQLYGDDVFITDASLSQTDKTTKPTESP
ncbi:MAG: glycosyltransferase [Methylococcales bacterium]|jgi:exo-beta-1,3-glucanase (GH17 family)/cellulose synthase/poly-beta-1,6-N-acetylglucosamine synthase-like glycosyltransferase|nr:glycosyltransferase [Methylococcales bacterium]MBT7445887.1 glycosyltransferase [Methylococcales bacterium]